METENIDVVFRMFRGEVLALFPHNVDTYNGAVLCYAHIGQHGSADYTMVVQNSRLATETEYSDLKKELESIGYVLNIIQKQDSKKYLSALRAK